VSIVTPNHSLNASITCQASYHYRTHWQIAPASPRLVTPRPRGEGPPSIPIESYLRLMFLKYRYGLGYERLCVQVTDSSSWRRFCRVGLEAAVPDESTIRKITRRCGPELIEELKTALLTAASERGEVSVERVRVDTSVVEADVKYPTDSGLLTAATCQIASRLSLSSCLCKRPVGVYR
jgi:IS5 family transposase